MKRFGIYDTQDNLWMGDDKGPKLFCEGEQLENGHVVNAEEAELFARAAAVLVDVQLRQQPGRTMAMPYEDGPLRLRDEKVPAMSTLEALERYERGLF